MELTNIFLIGSRGAGKTSVGQILARKLGWSFVDTDVILESRFLKSIREIFDQDGEETFRANETILLRELGSGTRQVVATGGGIVLREENRLRLRATGIVFWLAAEPDVLWCRIHEDATTKARRPDLSVGGLQEVKDLLCARLPLYQACAHQCLETGRFSPEEVAQQIWAALFPDNLGG